MCEASDAKLNDPASNRCMLCDDGSASQLAIDQFQYLTKIICPYVNTLWFAYFQPWHALDPSQLSMRY